MPAPAGPEPPPFPPPQETENSKHPTRWHSAQRKSVALAVDPRELLIHTLREKLAHTGHTSAANLALRRRTVAWTACRSSLHRAHVQFDGADI